MRMDLNRMRRFFSTAFGLAALCFAATAIAQEQKPAPAIKVTQCRGTDMLAELKTETPDLHTQMEAAATAMSNTEAVLWKVEKDGLPASYLFGTMHLSDNRITTLTPATMDAIKASKTVALEIADLSETAMGEAMAKAAEQVLYSDGQSLKSKLSDDEYKGVQSIVQKAGMPGEFAEMFRPWIVSMMLATSDCEKKNVAAGAPVLDTRVGEEAKKLNIPIVSLETIQQQLGALANVPDEQQIQMLKVGLKYLNRADDMMETLVQMYLRRGLGAALPFQIALAAKHGVPASAFDGFKQSLLVVRNKRMLETAKPMLEKGGVMIAVGALHLPGDTGLVSLARDAGYTVTKIE
jgi:uncharacterized protein